MRPLLVNVQRDQSDMMVALATCYAIATCYSVQKLRRMSVPRIDSRRLFVMGVVASCALRTLCFVGLAACDFASTSSVTEQGDAAASSSSVMTSAETEFFERVVVVMADMPDFIDLSNYVLLCVVWAEHFLEVTLFLRGGGGGFPIFPHTNGKELSPRAPSRSR